MARTYCLTCKYPIKTCVCEAIQPFTLPIKLLVIQHPSEAKNAKNTVRLAKLINPSMEIILSTQVDYLNQLLNDSCTNTALIYPNPDSVSIENYLNTEVTHNKQKISRLVFIDGTWKQAYGIFKSIKSLQQITSFHFLKQENSQYKIRCSKKDFQLSSIEAIAYSLHILFEVEQTPYLLALKAMQDHWPKQSNHSKTK